MTIDVKKLKMLGNIRNTKIVLNHIDLFNNAVQLLLKKQIKIKIFSNFQPPLKKYISPFLISASPTAVILSFF